MSHYTGSVPECERAADWRDFAVCRAPAYRNAMYPDNNEAGIARAKEICGWCPVALSCLRDAIRTGDDQFGIRGGLKPEERRKVAKLLDGQHLGDDDLLQAAVYRVTHPAEFGRTLQDVWDQYTTVLADGHLGWTGTSPNVSFQGRAYTPKQIAFQVDRGHEPKGVVRRTCDVDGCVHPRHLADNVDRHRAKEAAEQAKAAVR